MGPGEALNEVKRSRAREGDDVKVFNLKQCNPKLAKSL